MPSGPSRFSQLRTFQAFFCAVAMIGGGLLIALALLGYATSPDTANTYAWVAFGAFLIFAALVVLTITPLILKIESTTARQLSDIRDGNELLEKMLAKLEAITENTRISDAAKSLAHRDEEIEALRQTIREDIRNGRWEAAYSLVRELSQRFGYEEEITELRGELEGAREDAIANKLAEVIQTIQRHITAREWDRAKHEIERIKRALPDDPRVIELESQMNTERQQCKDALRSEWDKAVASGETDHAIEVLKALDHYLTPEEGKELENIARSVFKEKIVQLGVQFRMAVKHKEWQSALDTGLEIVREFPNARMAQEVREMIDILRERAREVAEQEASA